MHDLGQACVNMNLINYGPNFTIFLYVQEKVCRCEIVCMYIQLYEICSQLLCTPIKASGLAENIRFGMFPTSLV